MSHWIDGAGKLLCSGVSRPSWMQITGRNEPIVVLTFVLSLGYMLTVTFLSKSIRLIVSTRFRKEKPRYHPHL